MEARALSPRAARSCVNVDPRKGKEKKAKGKEEEEEEWEQPKGKAGRAVFLILKSVSAPVVARAPLLIVSPRTAAGAKPSSRSSSSSESLPRS